MSETDETEADRALTTDGISLFLAISLLIELCQEVQELFKEFERLEDKL